MRKEMMQSIMVWLLPMVTIGGLFFPILGYLVFLMMLSFIILSYFKGRFWCRWLCPRGAFLDLALSKMSLRKKLPVFFTKPAVRWLAFAIFMFFFILQFILGPKNIFAFGFVFVRMCLVTTIISIVLGVPMHERSWCVICPMGTLQGKIGSLKKGNK